MGDELLLLFCCFLAGCRQTEVWWERICNLNPIQFDGILWQTCENIVIVAITIITIHSISILIVYPCVKYIFYCKEIDKCREPPFRAVFALWAPSLIHTYIY